MTVDMLGDEIHEGDLVIIPVSHMLPSQRRILEVVDPDVISTRNPGLDDNEYHYALVKVFKVIEDNHPHVPIVRDPHPRENGSAESLPYEVKPEFLLKVQGWGQE